ncbi:MAG TPA: sigma-70 family RNA polymerase sigma factor [Actinospica sp.]|nr:sigma-70 family RNA polymerase sigma factor [Actinospica sp.]
MTGADRRARRSKTVFEVFYDKHQDTWRGFAYLHTGDAASAEEITDQVTGRLMQTWDHALAQENVADYAWDLLKRTAEHWLREHETTSKLVETASFERVARALADCREQFEVMEESLGLYSAIAELPERQRDVIVLRYVMGCPDETVAGILGIAEPTVRSNLRFARQSLERTAVKLRLLHTTETEG